MTDEGPYPLYEFTASGLTHVNEEHPLATNDYRVAGPVVDRNFGLMEIDWDATPSPLISFRVLDIDGDVQLEYTVDLDELRARQADGPGKRVVQ